jgi:hypothetical protein
MSIEQSLKKVLFSAKCDVVCGDTNCDQAVAMLPETGRWYITFGHAGFNSHANNRLGYSTKEKAMGAMRHYLKK